jgi:lipopolysaccharide export system permease protein
MGFMKILDKYIAKTVLAGILIVLVVLVGLFTFFAFIEELDDIGKQHYGIWEAIEYVSLEIPRYIYELFPVAALLGNLGGLGILANNSELTVMRAAGVSILRIAMSVLNVGVVLLIVAMLIGETLAPLSGQYAKSMRAMAQSEHESQQMVFNSRYGFWARDGNNFINIRTIFPDGRFGTISLYEFDEKKHLTAIVYAQTAFYQNGQWLLEQVEKIHITNQQVSRELLKDSTWNAVLKPELVKIVVISPDKLSSWGLYKYIDYLKQNGQRTAQYELAFWARLSYPLVCITMLFLSIPFVFGQLRSVTIGQRILVGSLFGIGFHMLNQTVSNIGLVYDFSPAFSAWLPPVLFLMLAVILMRRVI